MAQTVVPIVKLQLVAPLQLGPNGAHVLLPVEVVPKRVIVVSSQLTIQLISVKLKMLPVMRHHAPLGPRGDRGVLVARDFESFFINLMDL